MKKYEFRLISACVDAYMPICRNRLRDFALGLEKTELAHLLHRLFQNGDLLAYARSAVPTVEDGLFDRLNQLNCFFVPELRRIESALDLDADQAELGYAISPKGATRWEAFAKPEWEKFVEDIWHGRDNIDARIETVELRGQVERLQELISERFPDGKPLQGTEEWREFSPWQATYWKTLPRGANVIFRAVMDRTVRTAHSHEFLAWAEFVKWFEYPEHFREPRFY